jgi:hypothetical protein
VSQSSERDWLIEQSIREHVDSGGRMLSCEQVRVLLDEIDRLRGYCARNKQAALDISDENDRLRKLVPPESERGPGFVGQGSWSVFAEKVVEERDELRDELSSLCEEIRCLKEENDELKESMRLLVNATAYKKEHTNTHFNDKKDFVGLDGYGRFSVQKANDCLWILKLPNETVAFYNRKGRRVCANHVHSGDM